ncbi:nicotinate phosphoribosyltransferase [Dethiobacter alkaliphilus]|uniref:nicotinate phosphoribosyltransferase n=1 Tax=Dethiobacter alkaliphilus TaxID=427926 RepID=UPI002225C0BA|nr:nicotinate phosphoribosyltransferase [Dethiobacter alkaliphilus]MCW3489114.1 nicotinate phosphoribosyltransferase [Dethiobacter alkaliphilus]
MKELRSLQDVQNMEVDPGRKLNSATHEEVLAGATTDIYFIRTLEILNATNRSDAVVTAEVFASRPGVLCGIEEAVQLLKTKDVKVWALEEGEEFAQKEVVLRIKGRYSDFGIYETGILGMLASSSGWATAARRCKELAGDRAIFCFGARHVHPAVAPVMERAAIVGGADGCSCILGAKLAGRKPSGTVPHAVMLIVGDTVEVALAYDRIMPTADPRIVLVDTFKDEAEETLRVAEALQDKLTGVRLDTPSERGGVRPGLVREIRARLDQAGYNHVKLFVSGGIDEERMPALMEAGTDAFGVGSFISRAPAIDMTMDIKELDGKPIAKRGRIPGITESLRLKEIL